MQYMGGKTLSAKYISEIINKNIGCKTFYSLFCGACSIESKVKAKLKICNDYHEYLIELLKACQNGYVPPENVTKEDYEYIKNNLNENKALAGFVGFGCSFGGKWFGGYAKCTKKYNYANGSKNSLLKKMKTLGKESTIFLNLSYDEVIIENNSVIYCDPPYKETTSYSNSTNFNHEEFWQWCRNASENNIVFISELKAPEDFICIWETPIKRDMDNVNKNMICSTEKLFIHKSNLDKIIL